jgi:ferric-dicitrate binding protein FerR (iron transport regulator)
MAQSPETGETHVVRPGETLWSISRQHLGAPLKWPQIQGDNAVPEPTKLQPGQVLQVGQRQVAELSGTAWITRGAQARQALAVGASVATGDTLETERNTFLSLRLSDGSRVVVPSSSMVRVLSSNARLTRLELLQGRVESYVQKQDGRTFEVQTRTGKLGVRGTHFRVRDEDGVSSGEVINGEVQVERVGVGGGANERTIRIGRGQGALLAGSDALAVHSLLPAPGAIDSDAVTVSAAPVQDALAYRVQLARDEQFQQIFFEARAPAPRFTLPPTLEPGFHHLRLTAFDARHIEGLPGRHVLFVPMTGASASITRTLPDRRVEIRWPALAGRRYSFELARTSSFAPVLLSQPVADSGGVVVGPFAVPGGYHWRAQALDTEEPPFVGGFEVPMR